MAKLIKPSDFWKVNQDISPSLKSLIFPKMLYSSERDFVELERLKDAWDQAIYQSNTMRPELKGMAYVTYPEPPKARILITSRVLANCDCGAKHVRDATHAAWCSTR